MEGMYEWAWVIMLIIAMAAVIKVITLIHQKKSPNRNSANGNQRITSINTPNLHSIGMTETGSMVYYANDRHGRSDKEYRFNYKKVGDSWRAYILKMPSLGNRDASGIVTHRLYDNGRPYVCWNRSVNTLKDMQTISKVWADKIQEYIATGKRFG